MKLLVWCAPVVLMAGCATAQKFTAADGRTAYIISCDGSVQTIGACFQKAEESCGGAFDIVDRREASRPVVTPTQYGPVLNSADSRSLEVVCKT